MEEVDEGVLHPFNQDLYNEYDSPAKEALSNYLNKFDNLFVSVHSDYGVDLTSLNRKTNQVMAHEVNVLTEWIDDWPEHWPVLTIPYRKRKLLDKHEQIRFWVMNKGCTKALMVDGDVLRSLKEVVIPNKRIPNGEKFYKIPLDKCKPIVF